MIGKQSNTKEFINSAKSIHGDRYDYSTVNYIKAIKKVIIICPKHGPFKQTPNVHLNGSGCKNCYNENRKKTIPDVIIEFKKIHGNKYDYSLVKKSKSVDKINIICPVHGRFSLTVSKHIAGRGCQACGRPHLTIDDFIIRAKKIHGNKYDYSKSIVSAGRKKIKIICKIHGEFCQDKSKHLFGNGCKKCASDRHSMKQRLPISKFIKRSKIIHKNKYDYSKLWKASSRRGNKVEIICPLHGDFLQSTYHHVRGVGCPKCHHRISKPEDEFLNYLKIKQKNRQIKICSKLVDGFDDKTKTVYEFLGDFWHGNPDKFKDGSIHPFIKKTYIKIRNTTFSKLAILKKAGFVVKYIWESDWKMFLKKRNGKPNIQIL